MMVWNWLVGRGIDDSSAPKILARVSVIRRPVREGGTWGGRRIMARRGGVCDWCDGGWSSSLIGWVCGTVRLRVELLRG